MNRRSFLKAGFGAAAVLSLRQRAYPFAQSPSGITKFVVPLPGLGPSGIPVLTPNTTKYAGTDYYEIVAQQFKQQVHPNIPATTFWGYADAANPGGGRYLGGAIVATHRRPVKLKITNLLPPSHILPVDPTSVDPLMAAEVGGRVDRIAVHLHGGLVQWTSDGGPFAWFSNANNSPGFVHGSSFLNGAGPGAAIYDYGNDQSARLLWYHDHAYGNTRLNAYAGLASAYLITDHAESALINSGVLPNIPGYPLGIPLVLQDKSFFDPASDPSYPVPGATKGSLWYPHVYEAPPIPTMAIPPLCDGTGRWDNPGVTTPPVSVIPECFCDTMLVNGAPYPTVSVTPRRFRFRLLNGSQARFYNLQMYVADNSADGITLQTSAKETDPNGIPLKIPSNPAGPKIIQIGTEGGFLPGPVVLNDPPKPVGYLNAPNNPRDGNVIRYNLLLAPGERSDILVDFRGFEGRTVILYNDAPAPFPGGDIRNDYYPGGPDLTCIGGAPTPVPGQGPDTRILMRFVVANAGQVSELDFQDTLRALKHALPIAFREIQPELPHHQEQWFEEWRDGWFGEWFGRWEHHGWDHEGRTKVKTLNESFDNYGRLIQKLGAPDVTDYLATPTEVAHRGETQVWQIYNLTGDTHPMHFHLVDVQILKREAWQFLPDDIPVLPLAPIRGTARPPDANERGWKETVRMNPGEVVTVTMRFDMPSGAPPSPRLQASYGIRGAEYVWHCHILEHEEHDMMHALVVV
jgi:spore coat protein A